MKTKEQTAEKYSKIKNIFTYSHIAAVVKTHKKKQSNAMSSVKQSYKMLNVIYALLYIYQNDIHNS